MLRSVPRRSAPKVNHAKRSRELGMLVYSIYKANPNLRLPDELKKRFDHHMKIHYETCVNEIREKSRALERQLEYNRCCQQVLDTTSHAYISLARRSSKSVQKESYALYLKHKSRRDRLLEEESALLQKIDLLQNLTPEDLMLGKT